MTLVATIAPLLKVYWLPVLVLLFVVRCAARRYQHGLSDIPGPFWASFTDLWSLYRALRGLGVEDYKLHRTYRSSMIRLGPRTVAFSDPEACRTIYGYKPIFKKVTATSHAYTHSRRNHRGPFC